MSSKEVKGCNFNLYCYQSESEFLFQQEIDESCHYHLHDSSMGRSLHEMQRKIMIAFVNSLLRTAISTMAIEFSCIADEGVIMEQEEACLM